MMENEPVADFNELEEGEISNDDCFDEDIYTPLERPVCQAVLPKQSTVVESDADECPTSTDSDSSDSRLNISKIRKKNKVNSSSNNEKSNMKNAKIWCSVLEAEAVTNNLINCNLDEYQKRIRGLVPYEYREGNNFKKTDYNDVSKGKNNDNYLKRNYSGQSVNKDNSHNANREKFNKFKTAGNSKCKSGVPKDISALPNTLMLSIEKLAEEIAQRLNETKTDLVLRAVQIAGKETIIKLFEETRKVEKSGGLLIMNGSRRRTSGGVFFYLLKTSTEISLENQRLIFQEDKKETNTKKKIIAKEIREARAARRKELDKDDFPTLLSRTEMAIREFKEKKKDEESMEMENPPPSPVTDG